MGSTPSETSNASPQTVSNLVYNAHDSLSTSHNRTNGTSPFIQTSTLTTAPDPLNGECIKAAYGLPNIGCSGSSFYTIIDDMYSLNITTNECVLWNSSCSGNKTMASDEFFNNTRDALFWNACFVDPTAEDCLHLESADRLAEFKVIKEWMETPQCWSGFLDYDRRHGQPLENGTKKHYCCDRCDLYAENVEIFYWPELDADTSCLGVVGDKPLPIDYGGTTNQYGGVYWGCTTSDAVSGAGNITTATITTMGSLSVKETMVDPWGPQPCLLGTIAPSRLIISETFKGSSFVRDRTAVIPRSMKLLAKDENPSVTTTVLDHFTL